MKKATLIDKKSETELVQNGFILLKNFITPEEVTQILKLYKQHHPTGDKQDGMWNSLYNISAEKGLEISRQIMEILKPRLNQLFESYYAPVATFMSKNPNENSTCEIHRDFSITDEDQFQYRNIWIPLVPTTTENGALYVLKGSNNVFRSVSPMFSEWPYQFMEKKLFEHVQTIYCNAGDLVIYLDKTLHGSHINYSNDSRPAVHFGALHPDVQLLFYFLDKTTKRVRAYEVPFEFYFQNDFSEPIGRFPLYSEFEYNPPKLSVEDTLHHILAYKS